MRDLLNKAMMAGDSAEIFKKEEEETTLVMLQGKVQKINGKKTTDIALRLVKDDNMGTAVSTSMEDETVIERALTSCKYQRKKPVEFSNDTPSKVDCFDKRVADISVEEMAAEGGRVKGLFSKYAENIVPDIYINKLVRNIHVINSRGFNSSYDKTNYSVSVITKTQKGFMEVSYGIDQAGYGSIGEDEVLEIINRHRISQNRVTVETGKMPIIFSGNAFGALVLRFLAGAKAGNIIKKVSPLEDKLNQKIFTDKLTIRDNGLYSMGAGSCPFDDEGTRSTDTLLLEKGILRSYLAGRSEADKVNMAPTGNSFKRTMFTQDIEDAPAVDSTNILIEGDSVPDDRLISSIDRGIFIDSVMGTHTGNINAGQYSLNIGCGYLIENGKLTAKVMDAMVAGNIYEDFKKIIAIGTKREAMPGIFYHMGYSPNVLFEELSIVGKK